MSVIVVSYTIFEALPPPVYMHAYAPSLPVAPVTWCLCSEATFFQRLQLFAVWACNFLDRLSPNLGRYRITDLLGYSASMDRQRMRQHSE